MITGILTVFTLFYALSLGAVVPRIVNGSDAVIGEFPYAVSIRYLNCHECGGSIIGNKWILTAAHCVYSSFTNVSSVLYGTIEIQNCQHPGSYTVRVKRAVTHYNYQEYGSYLNDIALLELEHLLEFSAQVQPLELPKQGAAVPRLVDSYLVGWGYQKVNGTVMPILQKVGIVVFPDDVCERYHGTNYSTISHICVGVPGGGKGQCSGDSGGALTTNGIAQGIVSWSNKPCATSPGILTRISSFRDWINDITGL